MVFGALRTTSSMVDHSYPHVKTVIQINPIKLYYSDGLKYISPSSGHNRAEFVFFTRREATEQSALQQHPTSKKPIHNNTPFDILYYSITFYVQAEQQRAEERERELFTKKQETYRYSYNIYKISCSSWLGIVCSDNL